jgi:peptidoglycan/LPS O-acetylase OafA/YrhL/lysophospholipase L1-like esterase
LRGMSNMSAVSSGASVTITHDVSRTGIRSSSLPYLPGLDGVRALAVSAVLLFHLPARLLPGGFLGVDVFFVLSGFLITSLLLGEVEGRGSIGFAQFYVRRARRLLPALLVVLAASAALVLTVARDAASVFRDDLLSAVTYTANWWYVIDERSYFESLGRPPMLQHLWSLALEEQFYLVWPAVLLVSWRLGRRRVVGLVAPGGAVVSTVWMSVLAAGGHGAGSAELARVYFGSDTHAMTVLVGAALATVWRPARLPRTIPQSGQVAMGVAGGAAALTLVAAFLTVGEATAWLYHGGFLLVAGAAALLVAAAAHPGASFGQALGAPALRWLGTRSYGIYLWHWPIFLVTRPDLDLAYGGWAAAATSLTVTGLVAEASYRWVELPVRQGRLMAAWRRARGGEWTTRALSTAAAAVVMGVLLAGGVSLVRAPAVSAADYLGGVTSVGTGDLHREAVPLRGKPSVDPAGPGLAVEAVRLPSADVHRPLRVTAIGDSVLLGARSAVRAVLPRVTIDAGVSRQPDEAIHRVVERRRADALGDIVILATGTNGIPSYSKLSQLLTTLRQADLVVLVNVRSPVPWMEQSNAVLARAARERENVTLVDWASMSRGHGEYFVADGTHLTEQGAAAYANAIRAAVAPALPR